MSMAGAPARGRVLAIDGGVAIVRGARGDARVAAQPGWRAGDLVDGGGVVAAYAGGDYPGPATEVARLSRARIGRLEARARALAALRGYFAGEGFLEVETPLIVPSPGLEPHLDAVAAGDGYLITSPEYHMKRLLAAGLDRIYQVCRCFRAGEHGPQVVRDGPHRLHEIADFPDQRLEVRLAQRHRAHLPIT